MPIGPYDGQVKPPKKMEDKPKGRQEAVKEWEETIEKLVEKSQKSGGYPVTEGHCFQRIILDQLSGGVWYGKIKKPAKKNMTQKQLEKAIEAGRQLLTNPQRTWKWNDQSKTWRRDWRKEHQTTRPNQ